MTGGHVTAQDGPLDDIHFTAPLYRKAEAARIIRIPASTLRNWAGSSGVSDRPSRRRPETSDLDELLTSIMRSLATLPQAERAELPQLAELPNLGMRAQLDLLASLPLDVLDKLRLSELDKVRLQRASDLAVKTYVVAPEPLITTAEPPTPRGPTVPFVGLAEAFVLASFRSAGVPVQRIRPAVRWLQDNIGVAQALASERLKTDGAEVLWDYAQNTNSTDVVEDLVVVRNGQQIFRPVVAGYLRCVTYQDGWARVINVGRGKVNVTVDPWINGGNPTLVRRGIAVSDVLSRIRAGESSKAVAADYGISAAEIMALLELAA
jgi:uncharacterized protein (DUF433 family)